MQTCVNKNHKTPKECLYGRTRPQRGECRQYCIRIGKTDAQTGQRQLKFFTNAHSTTKRLEKPCPTSGRIKYCVRMVNALTIGYCRRRILRRHKGKTDVVSANLGLTLH